MRTLGNSTEFQQLSPQTSRNKIHQGATELHYGKLLDTHPERSQYFDSLLETPVCA